jgi:hypothetical protein
MPAIYALGWFLIGMLPAVTVFPMEVSAIAVGVGAAAQLSARFWKRGAQSERRFELSTLKKVFSFFAVYLLLLSLWPTTLPLAEWSNALDYRRLTEVQRIVFVSRFIEVIAAFTLLGYMVAGMRSRKNESALKMLSWVCGYALAFSILTAVLRDFFSGPLSSVLEATLFTSAALYGAVIYQLQLAGLRRMQAQEQGQRTKEKGESAGG